MTRPTPGLTELGAMILCGGESRRMGSSKAWLDINGEPMLARIVRLVKAGGVGAITVVSAPGQSLPALPATVQTIADRRPGLGPLEGLAAGLESLSEELTSVFVVACDAPLLEPAVIPFLANLRGEHDVAAPFVQGRRQPLVAVYHRSVLPTVQKLLDAGHRSMRWLLEELNVRWVTEAEFCQVDPTLGSLQNVNTPDELATALAVVR